VAIRSTAHGLLATTSLTAPKRVSGHAIMVTASNVLLQRVSGHAIMVTSAMFQPKRVTGHYALLIASIHNRFDPILLESESEFYPFIVTYELSAGPTPEHNPYRPRIPEQFIDMGNDFYDFYEENQQIHREQHNITQMGDTTFPFQLAIETHDIKQFKLGAVGRFYHEDFGIIQARYVQFVSMEQVGFAQCPVGLLKNKTLLDWQVTNNYELSNPDLVVGISFPFQVPADDSFGWVIVDGPTLQETRNTSTTAAIGESFAWGASGSVSNIAAGKVIGRRVNRVHEATSLLPGQLWVRTESFSERELRNLIDNQTATLLASITALQDALGSIPGADDLSALNATIAALQTQLNLEIANRKASDLGIQEALAGLNFVTITQLNNAVTNAANALTAAVAALQTQIDEIRGIALNALALASAPPDFSAINDQITLILGMVSAIKSAPKGRFPIVDGAIPPNLVYLDDGSLVYVETF
jgi:hypothetical protein